MGRRDEGLRSLQLDEVLSIPVFGPNRALRSVISDRAPACALSPLWVVIRWVRARGPTATVDPAVGPRANSRTVHDRRRGGCVGLNFAAILVMTVGGGLT